MSAPPAPPAVAAHGLRKTYGLLPVLRGIDLAVPAGQVVALLGANGAGKSTLVRCFAGVCRPTGGHLAVLGTECHPRRPPFDALRGVGFVAHEPLVYLDLTPRQNLEFFARFYGAPPSAVARELDRFGIARAAERRTRTLSRGTLQRLALARALLHEPRLLLLDEPFTGLDEAGQEVLVDALADCARAGAAAVVVTHDLGRVAAIADRVVVLAGGRAVVDRAPVPEAAELAALYRAATGSGRGRDAGEGGAAGTGEAGDVVDRP